MKRKPDLRERALKAHRLASQNITGVELAKRLKVFEAGRDPRVALYDPDAAHALAQIGAFIYGAEQMRLSHKDFERLKVIARVVARQTMLGRFNVKTSDVDFAAGKRTGWCGKSLVDLTAAGLITMPVPGRIAFTAAGWVLVWIAGLIKPNWKVPA
jgi:hypothetical protein